MVCYSKAYSSTTEEQNNNTDVITKDNLSEPNATLTIKKSEENIKNNLISVSTTNNNVLIKIIGDIIKTIFEAIIKIDLSAMYNEESLRKSAVFISSVVGLFFGPNSEIFRTLLLPMVSNIAVYLLR